MLLEKQKDYPGAMEGYTLCLNQCSALSAAVNEESNEALITEMEKNQRIGFLKDVRGEVMLRIALLKKDTGSLDQSMQLCNTIAMEFNDAIRANALCLKGLIHEVQAEYPTSEIVYRSVLSIVGDHCIALERLGRVYLRYRETIPAAVQCFFKAVEVNPSNHVAWYLLGRCYMATSQYSDACEAYNRSINLNPNDPQTWCSLGVLYYAFGQYREALGMLVKALKLNPKMADAWYNVGALYDMCDQPDDAQMAYQKAKEHGLGERFVKAGIGINPVGGAAPSASGATGAGSAMNVDSTALSNVNNVTAGNLGAAAAAVLQQQQQQLQRQQMSQLHQQMMQQVQEQVAAAVAAVQGGNNGSIHSNQQSQSQPAIFAPSTNVVEQHHDASRDFYPSHVTSSMGQMSSPEI